MTNRKSQVSPSSEGARRRMEASKQRDTGPELALRSALHRLGLRYRVHVSPLKGMRKKADVVFTRAQVAIYVNGCFWHGCPIHGTWPKANSEFWRTKIESNRRRDAETCRQIAEAGWIPICVWEHEDPVACAQEIAAIVRDRAGTRIK